MTCIIAHKDGWMVADRRCSMGANVAPFAHPKIRRWGAFREYLVGLSGATGRIYSRIPDDAWDQDPWKTLGQILRDAPDENYSALLLHDGGLSFGSGDGAWYPISASYFAIGSGAELAMGWLGCVVATNGAITADDAARAIEFAATVDTGVGDGVQVERLK